MTELATVRLEQRAGVPVARVEGEIDLSNALRVQEALAAAVSNTAPGLVADLSALLFIDSAGLRLVFRLAEELDTRQQQLRLVLPAESPVRRVLELSKVPTVAPMHERVDDAVAAVT